MKALLAAFLLLLPYSLYAATTVMVMSISPREVTLMINGAVIRKLHPREASPEGVRLIELGPDSALIEVDGRQWQMRIGSSTSSNVVLRADAKGHFFSTVLINGVATRALVDTGATAVAMNMTEARRLGVDLSRARPVTVQTAGGSRKGWEVQFLRVQLGDIVLANIDAYVGEGNDPAVTLLGMSFLKQVDMQRSGDTLTLTRRH